MAFAYSVIAHTGWKLECNFEFKRSFETGFERSGSASAAYRLQPMAIRVACADGVAFDYCTAAMASSEEG